jgi:hypothetical protein
MNTHAPKRMPCVTFEITDLLHQRSSSGVLTLGFSQITQGAGFTARRCPVAPPKRGPDPAPRRALRLDDPLVATPLIAGSERSRICLVAASTSSKSARGPSASAESMITVITGAWATVANGSTTGARWSRPGHDRCAAP